eukprot:1157435-Pelagomonas_calceolata.AAC.9
MTSRTSRPCSSDRREPPAKPAWHGCETQEREAPHARAGHAALTGENPPAEPAWHGCETRKRGTSRTSRPCSSDRREPPAD